MGCGHLILIHPKPYSIYLSGTINLKITEETLGQPVGMAAQIRTGKIGSTLGRVEHNGTEIFDNSKTLRS